MSELRMDHEWAIFNWFFDVKEVEVKAQVEVKVKIEAEEVLWVVFFVSG